MDDTVEVAEAVEAQGALAAERVDIVDDESVVELADEVELAEEDKVADAQGPEVKVTAAGEKVTTVDVTVLESVDEVEVAAVEVDELSDEVDVAVAVQVIVVETESPSMTVVSEESSDVEASPESEVSTLESLAGSEPSPCPILSANCSSAYAWGVTSATVGVKISVTFCALEKEASTANECAAAKVAGLVASPKSLLSSASFKLAMRATVAS